MPETMDSTEKVKYLIENNFIMTLATANSGGKPWVSPVGFAYDEKYTLYWVSNKEALHSKNVEARPEVAISIFGKIPEAGLDGVYIEAVASEIKDQAEMSATIKLFADKRPQIPKFAVTSVGQVTGDAAWRVYKASPVNIYKRIDDSVNGQAITTRELVKLD